MPSHDSTYTLETNDSTEAIQHHDSIQPLPGLDTTQVLYNYDFCDLYTSPVPVIDNGEEKKKKY